MLVLAMARGQSEVIAFVLLLLISLLLVFTAVSWSGNISQRDIDVGRITAAENWMKQLDLAIQSTVKSGGSTHLDFPLAGQIGLADVGLNDTVELTMPVSIDLPTQWINLTAPGGHSLIRERKEGDRLKLQLSYPWRTSFAVDLFTDGPQITTPRYVVVERNSTYIQRIGGTDYTVARIRLLFG